MKINYPHSFNLRDVKDFDKIQSELAKKINLTEAIELESIELVAGVDLAYWTEDKVDKGVCSIIVVDYKTGNVIEKISKAGNIHCPYIPGYLAFRELPLVLAAAEELKSEPDIFMFDGNGYLHPKHMGIATHASFFLEKPTIGVAKTYFKVDNVDFIMPDNEAGAYTDIVVNNEIYGRTLRTTKNVKPVFVSVGNYISLDASARVVMHLINKESRIPIPTRLADLETHIARSAASGGV